MVTLKKENTNYIFEIKGLRKLWAMKSSLTIPASHIKSAYLNSEKMSNHIERSFPTSNVSGIIASGSYTVEDGVIFCDVVDRTKSIVVELEDEEYKKLIIEVENPEEAIKMLTNNKSLVMT